jgi:class 3 adenylate cyclase
MSQSRQLAAIMFTDIIGYTALMGNDEQNAPAILNKKIDY